MARSNTVFGRIIATFVPAKKAFLTKDPSEMSVFPDSPCTSFQSPHLSSSQSSAEKIYPCDIANKTLYSTVFRIWKELYELHLPWPQLLPQPCQQIVPARMLYAKPLWPAAPPVTRNESATICPGNTQMGSPPCLMDSILRSSISLYCDFLVSLKPLKKFIEKR